MHLSFTLSEMHKIVIKCGIMQAPVRIYDTLLDYFASWYLPGQ